MAEAPKELTLQQKIDAKHNAKTVWDSPKDTWEYITIPAENAIGETHAPVTNNRHKFEAGNTYLVPPAVAEDVRDRLKVYAKASVRVLQPKRDYDAERKVSTYGSSGSIAVPVDPATIQ